MPVECSKIALLAASVLQFLSVTHITQLHFITHTIWVGVPPAILCSTKGLCMSPDCLLCLCALDTSALLNMLCGCLFSHLTSVAYLVVAACLLCSVSQAQRH